MYLGHGETPKPRYQLKPVPCSAAAGFFLHWNLFDVHVLAGQREIYMFLDGVIDKKIK